MTTCGHPNDKIGWAAQTGAEFKLDFINPGDHAGFMARYAEGASGFGGGGSLGSPSPFDNNKARIPGLAGSVAFGASPTACSWAARKVDAPERRASERAAAASFRGPALLG